jgi:hypothetical protein
MDPQGEEYPLNLDLTSFIPHHSLISFGFEFYVSYAIDYFVNQIFIIKI